ncbi:MAG: hypothetical protein C0417_12340 [Chlorobiaceae bacterium]|nr:hypothetical protein [Chlorobiaceae bacterium]
MSDISYKNNRSIEYLKSKILNYFDSKLNIIAVYLFGSAVSGRMDSESDIDIAIITQPEEYNKAELFEMRIELSELLNSDIDLVCLNDAPVILRMQIFGKGIKLIDRNAKLTNTLIVRSQFEYDDLRHMRAPIEKQILNRRVYG